LPKAWTEKSAKITGHNCIQGLLEPNKNFQKLERKESTVAYSWGRRVIKEKKGEFPRGRRKAKEFGQKINLGAEKKLVHV